MHVLFLNVITILSRDLKVMFVSDSPLNLLSFDPCCCVYIDSDQASPQSLPTCSPIHIQSPIFQMKCQKFQCTHTIYETGTQYKAVKANCNFILCFSCSSVSILSGNFAVSNSLHLHSVGLSGTSQHCSLKISPSFPAYLPNNKDSFQGYSEQNTGTFYEGTFSYSSFIHSGMNQVPLCARPQGYGFNLTAVNKTQSLYSRNLQSI